MSLDYGCIEVWEDRLVATTLRWGWKYQRTGLLDTETHGSCPVAIIRYPDKSNLRKGGFTQAHGLRVQTVH